MVPGLAGNGAGQGEASHALLARRFAVQQRASREQPEVPVSQRLAHVRALQQMLADHRPALIDAVAADFGVRAAGLTDVADLLVLQAQLGDLRRNLTRWARPQRVRTPWYLLPARGWIQRQPLGVVGVMAPWNYPIQLSLGPAATALAAGNRVLVKPSEATPHTSALLAERVGQYVDPGHLAVAAGDVELAARFAALPWDHLFFTGSTRVGRLVAQAAAANLTPTTLELGGKSPCVVDPSCTGAQLQRAARDIAHGKLLNAGQTCIAPDYVLLPRGREAEFEAALRTALDQLYPGLPANPDYASLHSDEHHARLLGMLAEAKAQGARLVTLDSAQASTAPVHPRQMRPVLAYGVTPGMRLGSEEIFGPVLPVLGYDRLEEAIAQIQALPRPLALYWFGSDQRSRDQLLHQTVSGGVTLNDTLLHAGHARLPFGGVGASGWGACRGEFGFLRFTHQKAVLAASPWGGAALFQPPYGIRFDAVARLLRRWLG